MRTSRFPLATLKETPADAEIISHQLMLRAGMVRRSAAGLYSWLPIGLRVLQRVEKVVREEMNAIGAAEVLLPAVQPAELWQESERWDHFGPELLRFQDRHQRDFCLGPTHEEIITDLVRSDIKSYRQLPVTYYQIQTKFRDEIRPRFGVMRAREFIMKDAYSFHLEDASLQQTYDLMYGAYSRIFARLGLEYRAVIADSGAIGGSTSHEFHVLAESGEDQIAFSDQSEFAANVEMAEAVAPPRPEELVPVAAATVATPGQHTIADLAAYLAVNPSDCLKTLLVEGENDDVIALCLRGDHQLNAVKAEKIPGITKPLVMADEKRVRAATGTGPGSVGPVDLKIRVLADRAAADMQNFICGANQDDQHITGVNWERDLPGPEVADLRNVVTGDASPDGQGKLKIARGIEVGHIFQLGRKYSDAMNATVLDEQGRDRALTMGCYGIGVTRIVAAAIEQNHDQRGIVWPLAMAPFEVALLPLNAHKSDAVRETTEALYESLCLAEIDALLDDRGLRPGVMFADMELLGIPHRLVIGERGLGQGQIEYQGRQDTAAKMIPETEVVAFLRHLLGKG